MGIEKCLCPDCEGKSEPPKMVSCQCCGGQGKHIFKTDCGHRETVPCGRCGGKGKRPKRGSCPRCKGTGYLHHFKAPPGKQLPILPDDEPRKVEWCEVCGARKITDKTGVMWQ